MQHDYKNAEHIASIAAIPQIIERSILVESLPNEDIEKHPSITHYDYYVCGLKIGAEAYAVKAVIANMADGTRYYDHKLSSIEKGRLIDIIKQAPETSVSISTQTPESSALPDVKDTRLILILQTNASKIVDENGEPKVVYHQTNATVYINRETGQNWDELDWRERMEWDERDDWDEYWEEREFNTFSRVNARTTNELDGFFFAPEYDEYHEYGNRTIEAFLNIENPASSKDYHIDASKTNAGRDERIRMQNEGFDGVINKEDGEIYEYIAFNPNQIKSADPVTYDDIGNVIPLSERFNPEKEDIRYSLRSFDDKVQFITYEATMLGVQSYVMVAENTAEYLSTLKDFGVIDLDSYERSSGVYIGLYDAIVLNGDYMLSEMEAVKTLIHEHTHSVTKGQKQNWRMY